MTLETLGAIIAAGEVDAAAMMAAAIGQRLAGTPHGWDWQQEGAVCRECGLLLVQLPTTVATTRMVVVFGRPMPVTYWLTHAHAARADGHPACTECVDHGTGPCSNHLVSMCDTPQPELCHDCADDAAMPDQDLCHTCSRIQLEYP